MPSSINPNSINNQFPVAGVNNNTQGFRNNFSATVNNFTIAQAEISDLMNKAILTAPLTDGNLVVSNNLNTMPMEGGIYFDYSLALVQHGTLTATATEPFDFEQGAVHIVTLNGNPATTTVSPVNFPNNGFSQLQLQITVSNINHQLSFGQLTVNVSTGVSGYNVATNSLSFRSNAAYNYTLSSIDGTSWHLSQIQSPAIAVNYTPPSSIGSIGDSLGLVAFDASFIYVCRAPYDGVTHIWSRSAIAAW